MKKFLRIAYTDTIVFGGFKKEGRLFFVLPCIRLSICDYSDSKEYVFAFGILLWEVTFIVVLWK